MTVFPDASPLDAVLPLYAFAVLLTIPPVALVLASVHQCISTVAVLFIIPIISLVTSAVLPGVQSSAMHVVVQPIALVYAAVGPSVGALAIKFVVLPAAFVHAIVSPNEFALAVFDAIAEHARKLAAIRPRLDAWPMSLVALQVSSILHTVFKYHLLGVIQPLVWRLLLRLHQLRSLRLEQ